MWDKACLSLICSPVLFCAVGLDVSLSVSAAAGEWVGAVTDDEGVGEGGSKGALFDLEFLFCTHTSCFYQL